MLSRCLPLLVVVDIAGAAALLVFALHRPDPLPPRFSGPVPAVSAMPNPTGRPVLPPLPTHRPAAPVSTPGLTGSIWNDLNHNIGATATGESLLLKELSGAVRQQVDQLAAGIERGRTP